MRQNLPADISFSYFLQIVWSFKILPINFIHFGTNPSQLASGNAAPRYGNQHSLALRRPPWLPPPTEMHAQLAWLHQCWKLKIGLGPFLLLSRQGSTAHSMLNLSTYITNLLPNKIQCMLELLISLWTLIQRSTRLETKRFVFGKLSLGAFVTSQNYFKGGTKIPSLVISTQLWMNFWLAEVFQNSRVPSITFLFYTFKTVWNLLKDKGRFDGHDRNVCQRNSTYIIQKGCIRWRQKARYHRLHVQDCLLSSTTRPALRRYAMNGWTAGKILHTGLQEQRNWQFLISNL